MMRAAGDRVGVGGGGERNADTDAGTTIHTGLPTAMSQPMEKSHLRWEFVFLPVILELCLSLPAIYALCFLPKVQDMELYCAQYELSFH